jgi:dolichol-phosphate mannosyltransferase
MKPGLSIVIPVYNEDETCELFVNLLLCTLKITFEVIIVYDTVNDSTVSVVNKLEQRYENVYGLLNEIGPGAKNAFLSGVKKSKYDTILLSTIDEMLVVAQIEQMFFKIKNENYDLVSGTRYSKGGIRYGGFWDARILSYLSNKFLNIIGQMPLADSTTGFKMFKKEILKKIILESRPIGWAFALELSVKAFKNEFKLTEIPVTAVDRIFGGTSSYKNNSLKWISEYLKWFLYCFKNKT